MPRVTRWVVGAGLMAAGILLIGPAARSDDSQLKVKVGDPFPDIAVPATQIELVKKDGKELSIKDMKGKIVVIAFYPKALTGGWTIECNGFRDLQKEFNAADTVVLGASADTVELNQKFTDKEAYTFPLLCDHDLKLIKALGIQNPKAKMAKRVTFVVGRDGKIAKIIENVKPKGHADEVLKAVKELKGKK